MKNKTFCRNLLIIVFVFLHYPGWNQTNIELPNYDAESNFFRNGIAAGNGQCYFIDHVMNGITKFNSIGLIKSIPMGYPVYHITGNNTGTKLYFFNTLQSHRTGLYIYENEESININHDGYPGNDIEKAIGDCIFNPFTNQFLISECADFGDNPAIIRVIDDNASNSWVRDIELTDTDTQEEFQYPKEMFISPDGRLFVLVNMHRQQYGLPVLLEFTACDQGPYSAYTFLRSHDLSVPSVVEEYDFFSGHFAYDSRDGSVYVSVHLTELSLDPYNSVVNSTFDFPVSTNDDFKTGSLYRINKTGNYLPIDLKYPGKIICPGSEYPQVPSKFEGKTYIIGDHFFEYDIATGSTIEFVHQPFNDITYSPYHDKMFAIRDVSYPPCPDNRQCEIYCIDKINGTLTFTLFNDSIPSVIPGQVSNITFNPYDGKIYLYHKLDNNKLGQVHSRIVTFDPGDGSWQPSFIELPFLSLHPEMDHQPDHHYYMYNITKPLIDPVHNYIYFPNGGHSSVTRIDFEPEETIPLDPSLISWLSFPRLDRTAGNPSVNMVLGGNNIDPSNYRPLKSRLNNLPPESFDEIENIYENGIWPPTYPLSEIDSRRGYKLLLDYDPDPEKEWLHLYGNVIGAATYLNVYSRFDNWVGYWLYEKQSPFTAFPTEVLDKLRVIMAQHWICGKYDNLSDGNGIPQPSYWICACHEGRVQLKYGDMVILKTDDETENFSYQWLRYGNTVEERDRPSPEYYQYVEQPDYVPYLVELDSTLLPAEIGAFVNDTCVGATSVLAGDTLVLVPGYIEGMSGEVSFEFYYDSLKSSPKAMTEYWVENPHNRHKEHRTLHTSERQDYFLVSFKGSRQENNDREEAEIYVAPNPSREQWTITCSLPGAGNLFIEVFDLYGKRIDLLSKGYLPAGNHSFELKPEDLAGPGMSEGIYLLRLRCGEYEAITKLILLN